LQRLLEEKIEANKDHGTSEHVVVMSSDTILNCVYPIIRDTVTKMLM